MDYIEFKLHAGKVPYFVKDYLSYKVNDKYYGIAVDDPSWHIPETVRHLTEREFKEKLITAKMIKPKDSISLDEETVELTEKEKEEKIQKWILERSLNERN
jgi:hypothetical protein